MSDCKVWRNGVKWSGWWVVLGYDVYFGEGKIVRARLGSGDTLRSAWVYRSDRKGNRNQVDSITEAAFRAGVNRGTITIM